jgi:hypothetical protein
VQAAKASGGKHDFCNRADEFIRKLYSGTGLALSSLRKDLMAIAEAMASGYPVIDKRSRMKWQVTQHLIPRMPNTG